MATQVTERHADSTRPGRDVRTEIVRGTIDTDTNGDGTLTVQIDGYGDTPVTQATSTHGSTTNVTPDSFDIAVSGGPTSTTVDVEALVNGPSGVA
jgi:hypothetical protein